MKFSTEAINQIVSLIVSEFANQLAEDNLKAGEVEESLRELTQEIGSKSYGKALTLLDEKKHGVEAKCQCGSKGKRVSRREAKILSVFGWVSYLRSYYQDDACGHRWHPLDESEGLRAGRATPLMSSLLALSGVTVSFEEAQSQIKQYLGVEVSANTIREETQSIGERQALREEKWICQSQDLDYLQKRERDEINLDHLYGSIDGAFALVEKEWQEVKTLCWYQAKSRYGDDLLHAQEIAYYSSLKRSEEFGELLWGTGVQHRADQAKKLIFVCDGAAWIWKQVEKFFPNAVQIVDWYHACQYLHAVANALLLADDEQKKWLLKKEKLLWEGEVETIIKECQTLVKEIGEPAKRLISYYSNNQERMRYALFREKNYLIGSGTVESACKQVVTMRLKRPGASWTEYGAKMVAKARTAWLSGQWETITKLPLAI
ncbi:MAG: ISKra4 family transposase [Anaerolineae bacterium]|jgi:hypothetical protein|nr:ISKra4 family transposase [Anaerolineae bacterium]